MNPVLKKLGFRGQNPILIIDEPEEYHTVSNQIEAEIHSEIEDKYDFIMVFARTMAEAKNLPLDIIQSLNFDGHFWFCYPKRTSKKYKSDIKRDSVWNLFESENFRPVSQVSIDEDWSAMRFRDKSLVKTK